MSVPSISRRDFLKLVGLASLAATGVTSSPLVRSLSGALPGAASQSPNILVIVFDALSARNMSLYGYARATTPNLERFASRATVFHQHHAAGNFTSPGAGSLMLGVYPWTHRALQQRAQALERFADQNLFGLMPEQYFRFAFSQIPFAFTLLDQFRKHIDLLPKMSDLAEYSALFSDRYLQKDYYVASEAEAVALKQETHQSASLFLSLLEKWRIAWGNARLADALHDTYPLGPTNCRVDNPGVQCFVLEKVVDWAIAQAQRVSQPFLGYVHFSPPHSPYNPRADFLGLFDDDLRIPKKPQFPGANYTNNKALRLHRQHYDQFIAYADSEFGRIIDALERAGSLQNTVVIFTSDHGEAFERGILGHGTPALYEPLVHIPLLIALPGQKGRLDVHIPTSAVDVAPTLLSLAGTAAPLDIEGSILALNGSQPEICPLFAVEAKSAPKRGRLTPASFALFRWPYKLTQYVGNIGIPDHYELYDLESDPEELSDLYQAGDPTSKALAAELEQKLNQVQETG